MPPVLPFSRRHFSVEDQFEINPTSRVMGVYFLYIGALLLLDLLLSIFIPAG